MRLSQEAIDSTRSYKRNSESGTLADRTVAAWDHRRRDSGQLAVGLAPLLRSTLPLVHGTRPYLLKMPVKFSSPAPRCVTDDCC